MTHEPPIQLTAREHLASGPLGERVAAVVREISAMDPVLLDRLAIFYQEMDARALQGEGTASDAARVSVMYRAVYAAYEVLARDLV